jgi:teichuronic acid biosynthesis glycosyltransferase TuaG
MSENSHLRGERSLNSKPDSTDSFELMVSILIPARNASKFLKRAVESLESQTYENWEAIIVDDGSNDSTYQIAEQMVLQDSRLSLLRHEISSGAAGARNLALSVAKGRFIAFLDADDAWHPDKLSRQLEHIKSHGSGLSYTGFWRVNGNDRRQIHVPATVTREALLKSNCIGCLTVMYDRAIFGSVPMADIPRRQDYALWLTLLDQEDKAYGLNEPLGTYYVTKGSLSSNKLRAVMATWCMYHSHFHLSIFRSTFYLISNLLSRLLRG